MSAGRSQFADALNFKDLTGRVAIITGSTRGIGKECALALAREGCNIVVAAKSTEETPDLPGSIYTVATEIEALGAKALPFKLDVRDVKSCDACVAKTVEVFGRVDILINNASALWWHEMTETPLSKFDLITTLNTRGSFALARACLPHMKKNRFGRVICMSPPIRTEYEAYKGMTAYNISKFGMTMVAMGCAAEGAEHGITGFSLWPATIIESQASINFQMGDRSQWRSASILADAVVGLVSEESSFTGHQIVDEDYLQYKGLTADDLKHYNCVPDGVPMRIVPDSATSKDFLTIQRGDVRKLKDDLTQDAQVNPSVPSKL